MICISLLHRRLFLMSALKNLFKRTDKSKPVATAAPTEAMSAASDPLSEVVQKTAEISLTESDPASPDCVPYETATFAMS